MIAVRSLLVSAMLAAAPVAAAHANGSADLQACKAMAATLAPKQADIAKLTETRDAAATNVETTGEAWEDVQIHRRASAGHATKADEAKAVYDEAKRVLAKHEMALQSAVNQFNDDVAAYNSRCASK